MLLEQLEALDIRDTKQELAKLGFRTRFSLVKRSDGFKTIPYKSIETINELREILNLDPDNFLAMNLLDRRLIRREDVVEKLKLKLSILQNDYDCDKLVFNRVRAITEIFSQVFLFYYEYPQYVRSLSDAGLTKLSNEVWNTVLSVLWDSFDRYAGKKQLRSAYHFLYPPFHFAREHHESRFYKRLGVDHFLEHEARKDKIRLTLLDMYSAESGKMPGKALKVVCNEYAFEIGLIGDCIRLVKSRLDVDRLNGVDWQNDIYDSALVLLINTTRDCLMGEGANYQLSANRIRNGSCFQVYQNEVERLLSRLLGDESELGDSWRSVILWSYTRLDHQTSQLFQKALQENTESLYHSLIVIKRLQNKGLKNAAMSVARASLEAAKSLTPYEKRKLNSSVFGSDLVNFVKVRILNTSEYSNDLEWALQYALETIENEGVFEFVELESTFINYE